MNTITSNYQKNKMVSKDSNQEQTTFLKEIRLNWKAKRIALHIAWAVLNVIMLFSGFFLASGTDWEFVYLIATFMYCSLYWMLTPLLFDKLIGDEIN